MAKIEGVDDPRSIKLGRALRTLEAAAPYREVIERYPAGTVTLEEGEDARRVHRLVTKAAKDAGIRIRCSWDNNKTVLYWAKVTPKSVGAAA